MDKEPVLDNVFSYDKSVHSVIQRERLCNGYTNWQQGFTPRDHVDMQDRAKQRYWRIGELMLFAVGGLFSGLIAQCVAKPEPPVVNVSPAAVTVSPPAVNVTTPPVNVTIHVPEEGKNRKKGGQ